MNTDFFTLTGISKKSSKQALDDSLEVSEFLEKLKHLLNINFDNELELALKPILGDKRQCELFCKKIGYDKKQFIILLVKSNLDFMTQTRMAKWLNKIHFSENGE